MPDMISDYRLLIKRLNLFTCFVLSFCLPFFQEIIPLLILIFTLTIVLEGNYLSKIKENLSGSSIFLLSLMVGFYLLHTIGLLYTENISSGLFDVEIKFSLLLFPLLFMLHSDLLKRNMRWILYGFVAGNIVASFVCLFVAFENSISFIDGEMVFCAAVNNSYSFFDSISFGGNYFFYSHLSFFHHPSYFAMYIVFSISILLFMSNDLELNKLKMGLRLVYILSILFLVFMVFLLSSKTGILCMVIVLLFRLIGLIKNIKSRLFKVLLVVFSAFLIALLVNNPRVQILKKEMGGILVDNDNQIDDGALFRIASWNVSMDIVKDNLWLGVGTGDVKEKLMQKYEKKNIVKAVNRRLNVHNQFMETAVGQGVFGALLLLLLFFVPIILPLGSNKQLFLLFLLIVAVNFLFESMLNTQAGVVFFAFFYCFLVFNVTSEKSQSFQ